MSPFVKNFIEKYIDLIEDNEWEQVFLNWYNTAEEEWPDEHKFKELLEVLENASIKINLDARHDVIFDKIVWFLQNAMKDVVMGYSNSYGVKHVGRFSLKNNLGSSLGYSEDELHNIMDKAARSLNMRYTEFYGGGYTW